MNSNATVSLDMEMEGVVENKNFDEQKGVQSILHDIKEGKVPASKKPLDLKGVFLAGEDLSGMDLSDLTGINLSGARLFKATFKNAVLINANLNDCELTGADLTEANLENASASRVGLGMACLKGARMFRAHMEGATLSKADLSQADMRCVNLNNARIREADLSGSDFTGADLRTVDRALCNVSKATFKNADMRDARLRAIEGFEKASWIGVDIRDINFAGAYRMRRCVVDQNYLKEFREISRFSEVVYWLWWITSDCGRSLARWCVWITLQLLIFAALFSYVGVDYGDYPTTISPLYYSVVTLTTLGYGDIVPVSSAGQIIAMIEVFLGYIMLGGLLSIFSNKMARRGD